MTVLTIRAHKRYATRQPVRLRAGRAKAVCGLLIEPMDGRGDLAKPVSLTGSLC
jgi:hypothetical protein